MMVYPATAAISATWHEVENIYDMCQHLMDNGVTINRPPRMDAWLLCSPDNISIELLQMGDALEPAEPWTSMENIGHCKPENRLAQLASQVSVNKYSGFDRSKNALTILAPW